MTTSRIEYMVASELPPAPRNAKRHELDDIKASLRRFGFVEVPALDERTGRLVAGHGRIEALVEMERAGEPRPKNLGTLDGKWTVPVLRGVTFATAREAEAYLLASNRLTEAGGWDLTTLTDALRDLGDDAHGIGWTVDELDELLGTRDALDVPPTSIPEAHKAQFVHAAIKQIVLLYPADSFDDVVRSLDFVAKSESLPSHTDAVSFLLREYLAKKGVTL